MINKTLLTIILAAALCLAIALPHTTEAASYSISVRDITITPEDPDIGDTIKIKVHYRVEGYDPDIKLYLYIDDTLEKTYTKSHSYAGTYYYTFYYDSDDLEDRKHEIKIKAKVYDDGTLEDTDTVTKNIYFDEEKDTGTYTIDIQDLTITPDSAHAGDTIRLTAKFYINAPSSTKVKLYLYIDGNEEKVYTGNYNHGTRYHTFSYRTDDLEKGIHTAKIKTVLYKDSWLKDTDTQSESFYLDEKRGANHDLDFTSISYNVPLNPEERIPVTVTVKNSGTQDEENVKIKLILDSKTVYSAPFYLIRGHSKTKTLYIDTPRKSGKYELIILAYNQDTQQKTIQYIETHGYTLSLKISPQDEAFTGDWIKTSGYARQNGEGTTKKLNIYKDDTYEKTIIPNENGDYADYVKFDTPGYHKISVELENIKKDKIILIRQKETSAQDTGDAGTTIIETQNQQYTIIIVKEGKERIYIESHDTDSETSRKLETIASQINTTNSKLETINENIAENNRNTNTNFEEVKEKIDELGEKLENAAEQEEEENLHKYVDIETSNKELVVSNFGGNLVTITITNHLGSKNVFSVDTDFYDSWVFLPGSETIENKETKALQIYFNPTNAKGEYKGNITVYKGNETIKKIPLTLYVTEPVTEQKKKTEDEQGITEFIGPKTATGVVFLLALFIIVNILLYYRKTRYDKEEKRPLEPTLIPGHIGHLKKENKSTVREKAKENTGALPDIIGHVKKKIPMPAPKRPKGKGVYHVSWDQVIM